MLMKMINFKPGIFGVNEDVISKRTNILREKSSE